METSRTKRQIFYSIVGIVVFACMFAIALWAPSNSQLIRSYTDTWFNIEAPDPESMAVGPSVTQPTLTEFIDPVDEEDVPPVPFREQGFSILMEVPLENVELNEPLVSPLVDDLAILRFELVVALISLENDAGSVVVLDALTRAQMIVEADVQFTVLHPTLEQALVAVKELEQFDRDFYLSRLDLVGKMIATASFNLRTDSANRSTTSTFDYVANATPEDASVWDELADGLGSVYRVRRTGSSEQTDSGYSDIDLRQQFQLLILVERARGFLTNRELEKYVATLDELLAIVESAEFVDALEERSIHELLGQLRQVPASNPRQNILDAIRALGDSQQHEPMNSENAQ